MSILPAGRLTVHAHDTNAPTADHLLGRPHIPMIAGALVRADATIRGFISDPLHAGRARDQLLSEMDRALDVDVNGGARLRAIDAVDGNFHVHITPPIGSKDFSLHVELATEGNEKDAVVRADPHAPDAPIGFYNLGETNKSLATVRRVLEAASKAPETTRVNKLRADAILSRLAKVQAYAAELGAAAKDHPVLTQLHDAREAAHDSKKPGDAIDAKRAAIVKTVEAYLEGPGQALSAELQAQVKEDLATVDAERDKWHTWRASTGIFTYYM